MASAPSEPPATPPDTPPTTTPAEPPVEPPTEPPTGCDAPVALKILVAGGFGTGKTTLVSAVSEIHPLLTEEPAGDEPDATGKSTTTVVLDFGRITVTDDLVVYLFGTPGQDRFQFAWDELALGAIGAIVLADTRRLADCFASVDYFERRGTPFVVAMNCFDGARRYRPEDVRQALDLDPEVPVLACDARRRESAKQLLIALVQHVLRDNLPVE